MDREDSLVGRQIGNYRLTAEIASGSFGTVYQAHHSILTNRVVALKVLHMHLPARERERFFQEAQLLESLQHRHILAIVDVGFDDGQLYLASTYAPGGTLRQLLLQAFPLALPWNQALTILIQVGEALHYAHQHNIVHCDLKPENILFNAQGEAVLADFGIATMLSTMSIKQLINPEGTPSYMAPEQFRGEVSKQSDQYSLGCIAYELVTGHRLFSAPNIIAMGYKHATESPIPPHQINSHIASYVEQAVLKALAKQRNDRYPDAIAFLNALQPSPLRPSRQHTLPDQPPVHMNQNEVSKQPPDLTVKRQIPEKQPNEALSPHLFEKQEAIYIDPEDDLTNVRERLERISDRCITLVIPTQTQLRSHVAWKLLRARVRELGKDVLIVSSDPQIRSVAQAMKFRVASSLEHIPAAKSPRVRSLRRQLSSLPRNDSKPDAN